MQTPGFRTDYDAKWATFFDTLGVVYRYNHEVFTLSNGRKFLPSFIISSDLRKQDQFIEIREYPDVDHLMDVFNADMIANGITRLPVNSGVTLYGEPMDALKSLDVKWRKSILCPRCGCFDDSISYQTADLYTGDRFILQCTHCDLVTPEGINAPETGAFGFDVQMYKGNVICQSTIANSYVMRVYQSALIARSVSKDHNYIRGLQ